MIMAAQTLALARVVLESKKQVFKKSHTFVEVSWIDNILLFLTLFTKKLLTEFIYYCVKKKRESAF